MDRPDPLRVPRARFSPGTLTIRPSAPRARVASKAAWQPAANTSTLTRKTSRHLSGFLRASLQEARDPRLLSHLQVAHRRAGRHIAPCPVSFLRERGRHLHLCLRRPRRASGGSRARYARRARNGRRTARRLSAEYRQRLLGRNRGFALWRRTPQRDFRIRAQSDGSRDEADPPRAREIPPTKWRRTAIDRRPGPPQRLDRHPRVRSARPRARPPGRARLPTSIDGARSEHCRRHRSERGLNPVVKRAIDTALFDVRGHPPCSSGLAPDADVER